MCESSRAIYVHAMTTMPYRTCRATAEGESLSNIHPDIPYT